LKVLLKRLYQLFIFVSLTIVTQIGGVIYLVSLLIFIKWDKDFRFKKLILFLGLYTIATFLITPFIAPIFGREKIKHTNKIKPTNYMTVFLNRNYVKSDLNKLLQNTENQLHNTAIEIRYLDASFPFIDRFPLLPHLSHQDGKKIDISLIYETKEGEITNKQKSISGYGVFAKPKLSEHNQINTCLKKGYFFYDYPKYMTFGEINKNLIFSEKGTKKLLKRLLKNNELGKMFIEPHLKQRLRLTNNKVRYHGCRAVRHDDHIHVQLK